MKSFKNKSSTPLIGSYDKDPLIHFEDNQVVGPSTKDSRMQGQNKAIVRLSGRRLVEMNVT